MRQVKYTDSEGREIIKKEGFSWPTFWLLFFFTFIFGAFIYAIVKGSFIGAREISRKSAGTHRDSHVK